VTDISYNHHHNAEECNHEQENACRTQEAQEGGGAEAGETQGGGFHDEEGVISGDHPVFRNELPSPFSARHR
jgi:hypothetical protein